MMEWFNICQQYYEMGLEIESFVKVGMISEEQSVLIREVRE